jgi:hypothetical protein
MTKKTPRRRSLTLSQKRVRRRRAQIEKLLRDAALGDHRAFPTTARLAQDFQVSTTTINNDLAWIRQQWEEEILSLHAEMMARE